MLFVLALGLVIACLVTHCLRLFGAFLLFRCAFGMCRRTKKHKRGHTRTQTSVGLLLTPGSSESRLFGSFVCRIF
jgi:hypothetical protein